MRLIMRIRLVVSIVYVSVFFLLPSSVRKTIEPHKEHTLWAGWV